jgi:2-isopropylmalate synthase
VVFGLTKDGIIDIALQGARLCRKLEETIPETDVYYEYSPESYTGTELEFAVESATRSSRSSTRRPTTR